MSVYVLHDKELEYPIVFDEKTHKPDPLILRYAVCKHQYPHLVDQKSSRKCGKKTVVDAIQRVCYLINQLSEQSQPDGKQGVHYLAATFRVNMEPLIRAMYFEGDWRGESIEQYVKAWRQFYRFLTLQGVEHEMIMPETNEVIIKQDQDDNFLSHTSYHRDKVGEQETAVDHNWMERHDDYKNSILSMEQFWSLYSEMFQVDQVYAVMAYVELVTCLRVTALIDSFPMSPNKRNPNWLSYREMKRDNLSSQKLRYLAKGGKTKSLLVPFTMMDVFYHVYEKPECGATYYQRLKKYREVYCKTKHSIKSGRSVDEKPTWLLANGTPVSVRAYQKAMQECAKRLNMEAHPHMLRHTGVTQMLYRYIKNNGLLTGLNFTNKLLVNDAHTMLQQHLGHVLVETTKRYIRTIERIIQEAQLDMLLNDTFSISKKHQELLENNPKLAKGMKILEHAIKGADSWLNYKNRD
ncbi:MAG: tyrosine-type recombinase/integrase [Alteromonadaceae bacterium]|nr:tyrosine-type recombinase/integrase [Alteromonadaceae bacterium]